MEVQLEEEYEDKQKVLRERRELESKLLNAQDQVLPSLCLWVPVSAVKCVRFSARHFFLIGKEAAFECGEGAVLREDRKIECVCVTILVRKGVFCDSGEPEGCGDGEEAEERPEENQSPSG